MFLSANNFFWKITLHGDVMTRVAPWRDLGRPEAALIGVQYRANDRGQHRGAWIVTAPGANVLFGGAPVEEFGSGGIEIDATAPSSPTGVRILAQIPNLYGLHGMTVPRFPRSRWAGIGPSWSLSTDRSRTAVPSVTTG